ncbi:YesK family protein [Sporosarcina thermotolerans]|uniref:YesK family protein n=1 Tax=Sporosarcina thermotolerans TaxID=633404 RepID=A0AAW9A986_9BACL|nr:YesK family protein [Sporosarcina thermotolerans]MDW0118201.1 YesK family protein [Sporosarcina thermotolerans]WHT47682.1 YesK family protein [Sporosarcina thermotolerans]
MDILLPIGFGIAVNLVVFLVSKSLRQKNERSLLICLIAFLVVLFVSIIIGSWVGMGIGVVSLGMLIFVILTGIIIALKSDREYQIIRRDN